MTDSTITNTNYDNTIIGDNNNNNLTGGQLSDHILGVGGDDFLYGFGGDDFIEGGLNNDTIYGGANNDTLFGEEGDDTLYGEDGNDLIADSYGFNILKGGIGNDTLYGGGEIQFMYGGADNDTYKLFGDKYDEYIGYNYIEDTSGYDTITFSNGMRSIYLNLAQTGEQLINPYLKLVLASNTQIEKAVGTYDGDFIVGNALSNILQGGDINDSLYGKDPSFLDKDYFLGGAGDDILQGFYGNDILKGEADNDVLDGGGGIDIMTGGTGNDIYYVDQKEDAIFEDATIVADNDTVYSSSDYSLSANVENLVLTLSGTGTNATGNDRNNTIQGNNFNNYLYGYGGDDTLVGGTGIDTAYGGDGNDIYFVDSSFDVVVETNTSTTQIDTVKAFTIYALSANVENLQLLGTTIHGTGNNLNNTITGNNSNNALFGLDGNDILDGDGGGDTMYGGTGNDTYYVNNSGDFVMETSAVATEIDTVIASISYTLAANVENLTLTGLFSGSGTGNNLNNTIVGNTLNNTLNGGEGNDTLDGGTGGDTLIGGGGNDTYYVDNKDDIVTETSTATTEIDTVRASTNHYLRSNVEHLILTGSALNGFGNNLDNLMVGNSSNNHLEGGIGNDTLEGNIGGDYLDGGVGSDTMRGGIGGDIYIVDNIGDIVVETGLSEDSNPFPTESMAVAAVAEEYDKVFASVNYYLSENVEELHLTGTANLTGTGNYLNNALFGGDGNDTLLGEAGNDTLVGGAGDDTLTGGIGGDKFIFAGDTPFTRFGKTIVDPNYGVDRISDFSSEDIIVLDKTVFSGLQSLAGNGFSVVSEFVVVATDAEVTMSRGLVVYSQATGNLFYNQNSTNPDFGSGGWFATVANAPILAVENFVLTA